MSDIQEEQKRLYKRTEENDYIVKDIAQYEENDSELAKYTILELQNKINKAIEYIKEQTKGYQDNFDMVEEESWLYDLKITLNILQGSDKEGDNK